MAVLWEAQQAADWGRSRYLKPTIGEKLETPYSWIREMLEEADEEGDTMNRPSSLN